MAFPNMLEHLHLLHRYKIPGGEDINVPRDKAGDFVPVLIKKYQTDISSIEDKIIFLYPPERIDARYPPRR